MHKVTNSKRLKLFLSLYSRFNKQLLMMFTVVPAKSDSDVMFCLQSYQGL